MTNDKPAREPFDFWQSPWWKDMSDKLCSDGWPQVVVSLNSFIRPAQQAYQALKLENEELRRCYDARGDYIDKLKAENAELRADKEQYREEGKLEHQYRQERMNDLQSEVARLRDRLLKISKYESWTDRGHHCQSKQDLQSITDSAREALNHKPKGE